MDFGLIFSSGKQNDELLFHIASSLNTLESDEDGFVPEAALWNDVPAKIVPHPKVHAHFLAIINFLPFSEVCFQSKPVHHSHQTLLKLNILADIILSYKTKNPINDAIETEEIDPLQREISKIQCNIDGTKRNLENIGRRLPEHFRHQQSLIFKGIESISSQTATLLTTENALEKIVDKIDVVLNKYLTT